MFPVSHIQVQVGFSQIHQVGSVKYRQADFTSVLIGCSVAGAVIVLAAVVTCAYINCRKPKPNNDSRPPSELERYDTPVHYDDDEDRHVYSNENVGRREPGGEGSGRGYGSSSGHQTGNHLDAPDIPPRGNRRGAMRGGYLPPSDN